MTNLFLAYFLNAFACRPHLALIRARVETLSLTLSVKLLSFGDGLSLLVSQVSPPVPNNTFRTDGGGAFF